MKVVKYTFLLSFIMLSAIVFAQRGEKHSKQNVEKIKSLKISFLTEYLELTPEEAQDFWPLFNEMEGKRAAMFEKHMVLKKTLYTNDDFKKSDKECKALLEELGSFPIQDAELRENYNNKFLNVLSPQKVLKLYVAEDKFRHQLMKKYRGERDGARSRKDDNEKGPE